MKPRFICTAIVGLLMTMVSLSWAATNRNSSKSNVYRVIYDPQVVSSAQAAALLSELDELGPADEATLKKWLPANFKKHGVQSERIKKIVVLPASAGRKCADFSEAGWLRAWVRAQRSWRRSSASSSNARALLEDLSTPVPNRLDCEVMPRQQTHG